MVGVAVVESASGNWAAVQLKHLGASDAVAALGLGAFTAGMIAGRLVGDHLTDRWGTAAMLRAGLVASAAGYGLSALVGQPAAFVAAMAVAGAGTSGCFPLLFAAAARVPGLAPGAGIATASLAARAGFLVQPALIGAVADHAGLRPAFAGVAAVALLLATTVPGILHPNRS
jgi:MFS family permease